MNQLSREECVELGLSVPTVPLIGWAAEQLAAAKGRESRLECRGVAAPFLKELKTLAGTVADLYNKLGKEKASPSPDVLQFQKVREEALAYWQEAKQIVKIEFGNCPDIQAKSRLGIRTGRLFANLCREMELVMATLRERAPQLCWLGVDEAFLKAGDELVARLHDARAKLDRAREDLSPALAELCAEKGKLYDLTRKLVRIGQLEFVHEPEQAAAFNYAFLRKELRPGSEIRAKIVKSAGR